MNYVFFSVFQNSSWDLEEKANDKLVHTVSVEDLFVGAESWQSELKNILKSYTTLKYEILLF